jgi:hypothetical protein
MSDYRPLYTIAKEIKTDWKKINYAAKPYLEAMETLTTLDDKYYYDSAYSIVLYFLANASTWRGDTAKRIKAELKTITKLK